MTTEEIDTLRNKLMALQNRLPRKYAIELAEIIMLMREETEDEMEEE